MAFNGKRSARERIPSQVNVDPELSAAIRDSAARGHRSIGAEIVRLLTFAVLNDSAIGCYAQFLINRHTMAPSRTVTHINAQRRAS